MVPNTRTDLPAWAAEYAEAVPIAVDLDPVEWTVTSRAKRRAGLCRYDPETGAITIRLTWPAYEALGPERFRGVVRHELIHAWQYQTVGEADHGERFRRQADRLDVSVRCPTFTPARLRLVCEDCDWAVDRHRACPSVTTPEERRCGDCGGRYAVVHRESGRTWRTAEGYEAARGAIGDAW